MSDEISIKEIENCIMDLHKIKLNIREGLYRQYEDELQENIKDHILTSKMQTYEHIFPNNNADEKQKSDDNTKDKTQNQS